MKIAVIYKSNYGATRQYAQWISEELKADIFENDKVKNDDFAEYDVIIYGGGLYAGGINGINSIVKKYEKLKSKKIIIFTVGLADPMLETNTKGLNAAIDKSFTPEMQNNIKIFHLRGGIDYSKLSIVHKSMMAMLKSIISKKPESELTHEDAQLLETYGKKVSFTDRKTTAELIEYVKNSEI